MHPVIIWNIRNTNIQTANLFTINYKNFTLRKPLKANRKKSITPLEQREKIQTQIAFFFKTYTRYFLLPNAVKPAQDDIIYNDNFVCNGNMYGRNRILM